MYVYEALLTERWEQDHSFGLFEKKRDAKKACQAEDDKDTSTGPLVWINLNSKHTTSPTGRGNRQSYDVIRRRVHTVFNPAR
jgi:hypothetical protein